ncbi:hypothetical protein EMIT0194MI4_10634 [Pseudomonas sp. IT-194MI4]
MPLPRCSPWIKRLMGDPCDEILRNHSKGSRRRFYTLWAKRRLSLIVAEINIGPHRRQPHLS